MLGLKETQAQAGGGHTHPSRDNTPQLGLLEETRLNGVEMFLMRLSRNKNKLSHFLFLVDKENLNCKVRSPEAKGVYALTSCYLCDLHRASSCGHTRSIVKSDASSSLENGFSFWAVEQSLGMTSYLRFNKLRLMQRGRGVCFASFGVLELITCVRKLLLGTQSCLLLCIMKSIDIDGFF